MVSKQSIHNFLFYPKPLFTMISDSTMNPISNGSTSDPPMPFQISSYPIFSNRVLVIINFATQAPIKLSDYTNFLWKKQFDVFLVGYDLTSLIDGSIPCPPPTLLDKSRNSDYLF